MRFRSFLLVPALALAALAAEPRLAPATSRSLQREALLIMEYLDGYHYANRPFSDLEPKEVLAHHLEVLDPGRSILLADDVAFIHQRFDRNLKTVYLFKGDLNPAFEISELFLRRLRARAAWIKTLGYADLQPRPNPLSLSAAAEKSQWLESEEALRARWIAQLWVELGWEYVEGRPEEEALEAVKKRHTEYFDNLLKTTPERVRAFFLNSVMESFDPHTGYFSREVARDFDTSMRSSSEGMGVEIYEDKGRLRLTAPTPGSPADRIGGLQPSDELLAVSSDPAAPKSDHQLTRDEALAALSCAAGETRWLRVRARAGGEERVVKLISERFDHSENRCEANLIRTPGSERPVGYVRIPSFYGGESGDLHGDLLELLGALRAQGAAGMILDLRDNGGGLLHEAASVAGLFLHGGPVLQAKGPGQGPAVFTDEDPLAAYEGPLVILINSSSASASEALSGTLQQLGVAVVVGGGPSFGKGSSQDYVDMRQLAGGALSPLQDQWGVMRVTRQLFYYATGQSPQLTGVSPDIIVKPSRPEEGRTERLMSHPIPSETIPTLGAGRDAKATVNPELLKRLGAASAARVQTLPEFHFLESYQKLRQPPEQIPANLSAEDLGKDRVERGVKRAQLRKDWLLADGKGWSFQRLVPQSVALVEQAHDKALREVVQGDGRPRAERLQGFMVSTASGQDGLQREELVARLDFDCAMAEIPSLTALWNRSAGDHLDEATMTKLLDALRRHAALAEDSFAPLPVCRQVLGEGLKETQLVDGLDALLCQVAKLSRQAFEVVRFMDPQLREAVRITQDWAGVN
jgi:carboxyl-terminal processing protease